MSTPCRYAPASTGHRLLWLLERAGGADGALNLSFVLDIRGTVRPTALLAAMADLFRRHEALRTTFTGHGPQLTQVVHPPHPLPPEAVALVDTATPDTVWTMANQRFRLTEQWPARLRLLRTGPDEYVLLLVVHHIVADGVSMHLLLEDLWACYTARLAGEVPGTRPGWQQADFTTWQAHRAATGQLDGAIAYWRDTLGAAQPTGLPDGLAAATGTEPGRFHQPIPDEVTALVRAAAARQRCTVFTVLFAAFAAHLAATTGHDEVVVPVMFANRVHPDSAHTVGFLANLLLLPLRTQAPTAAELLRRSRSVVLAAMTHQEVPYHVVPTPPGTTSRRQHPQLLLEYHRPTDPAAPPPGLEVATHPQSGTFGTRFTAEFHILDDQRGLTVECFHAPRRVGQATLTTFLDGMIGLLDAAAGQASAR